MSGRQSKEPNNNKEEEEIEEEEEEDEEFLDQEEEHEEGEEQEEEEEDDDDNNNAKKGRSVKKEGKSKDNHNNNNNNNNSNSNSVGVDNKNARKGENKENVETEKLPACKPAVKEIALLLPGQGAEKITVSVRLSSPVAIQAGKKKPLRNGNINGRNNYVDEEEEEIEEEEIEEEEEEEEDEERSGGLRKKQGCPPWLPYLLSDDIFYWERTLEQMYGYAAQPIAENNVDPLHTGVVKEEKSAETRQYGNNNNNNHDDDKDDNEEEEAEEENEENEVEEGEGEDVGISDNTRKDEKEPFSKHFANAATETPENSTSCLTAASHKTFYNDISGVIMSGGIQGEHDHDSDYSQHQQQHQQQQQRQRTTSVVPQATQSRLSVKSIPLTVLRFTGTNTILFLVRSANGRRWYLLDTLPQSNIHDGESDRSTQGPLEDKKKKRKESNNDDDEEEEEEGEEEEEEEEEEEGEEKEDETVEGDQQQQEEKQEAQQNNEDHNDNDNDNDDDDGKIPSIEDLDMNSVICIDVLMLAALQSPTALRCCLSQREVVSFACMEEWLRMDLRAALPIFTTIHRMMLSVYTTGQMRLPYRLPGAVIDYNIFFTPAYLAHSFPTYPRMNINSTTPTKGTRHGKDDISFEGERQSIETMEALLKVQLLPSKLILVKHLSSVVGIRMLLHLLMEIPKSLLLTWGAASPTSGNGQGKKNMNRLSTHYDDDEYDDDDDERYDQSEEDNTDYDEDDNYDNYGEEEGGRRRRRKKRGITDASVAAAFLSRNTRESGPWFVPSPFLLAVAIDIRRRLWREKNGSSPSQFTLTECVAHALLKRVEDGHLKRDPLLVSEFTLLPLESSVDPVGGVLTRPQRLYHSDLVMLLLALTTTKVKRDIVVPQKEKRKSVVLRSRTSMFVALPDAHHELLQYLLRKKAEKIRTPEELAQSGYFRLLYFSLLRFKNQCTVQLLLSMTPLFTLFGPFDRCPFDDLVNAWLLDRNMDNAHYYIELFVDTFWNELHYRCAENQFDDVTLNRGRTLLIIDKVQERRKAYTSLLHHICSPARTRTQTSVLRCSTTQMCNSPESPASSLPHRPATAIRSASPPQPITICEYDENLRQAEEQVRLKFESLSMVPRTYLTPETLHAILFTGQIRNVNVARYLMLRCRVVTVHANPLTEPAVPAMEYALRCGDLHAVNVLLAVGVTLRDYIDGGSLMAEALLAESFVSKFTKPLLEEWKEKEKQRSVDPSVHYGILRSVVSPPQG